MVKNNWKNATMWLGQGDGFKSFTRNEATAKKWHRGGIKVTPVSTLSQPHPADERVVEALPQKIRDQEIQWAVGRWRAEVENRPLVNVHRRSLDDSWRQVIRHFGGDPEALCGPAHDQLLDLTAKEGR